jgi:hypothetical protein
MFYVVFGCRINFCACLFCEQRAECISVDGEIDEKRITTGCTVLWLPSRNPKPRKIGEFFGVRQNEKGGKQVR